MPEINANLLLQYNTYQKRLDPSFSYEVHINGAG